MTPLLRLILLFCLIHLNLMQLNFNLHSYGNDRKCHKAALWKSGCPFGFLMSEQRRQWQRRQHKEEASSGTRLKREPILFGVTVDSGLHVYTVIISVLKYMSKVFIWDYPLWDCCVCVCVCRFLGYSYGTDHSSRNWAASTQSPSRSRASWSTRQNKKVIEATTVEVF